MITTRPNYKQGLIKAGPIVSIVAAAAANIWIMGAGRTAIIRKLIIMNRQGAPITVLIGDAGGQRMPLIYAINGIELELTEEMIQEWEFTATITATPSAAAAAPADVQVQATVEEFQGPTG